MAKRRFNIGEVINLTTVDGKSFHSTVIKEDDETVTLEDLAGRRRVSEVTKQYIVSVTRIDMLDMLN